jgi:hypothetical protein
MLIIYVNNLCCNNIFYIINVAIIYLIQSISPSFSKIISYLLIRVKMFLVKYDRNKTTLSKMGKIYFK